MNRIGDFVETYSGISFYPLDPRPSEVNLEDIAHSLSNICRFGGHAKFFYSVAQHTINMYKYLLGKGYSEYFLKDAMFHDSPEAYMVDIPRPLKKYLQDYITKENEIQKVIYKKYGLKDHISDVVKEVDNMILSHEATVLMPCKNWNFERITLDNVVIEERKNSEVKEEFLSILTQLNIKG